MGFKDLIVFNNALLAKQGWRLLQQKEALWARVLKGLYFPHCSFLDAKKGARASWCWSSLMEGRDIIKDYGIWQVGNGKTIDIWNDRWIPGEERVVLKPECVGGPNFLGKVEEWIDKDKEEWDWEAVGGWISEENKQLIKSIPINVQGGEDRFVWTKERRGIYSVKAGYFTMKTEQESKEKTGPSSSYKVENKLWKEIWRLEVPNKVKNFMWRLCSNAVATNSNLYKRKVRADPLCPMCNMEAETIEHLCLLCDWTMPIWFVVCFGMRYQKNEICRFDEWLNGIVSKKGIDKEVKALIALTCWNIWKERCNVQLGKQTLNVDNVIRRVRWAYGDCIIKSRKEEDSRLAKEKEVWKAPEVGWIKVNCDGAWKKEVRRAAIGIVAKNEESRMISGMGKMVDLEGADMVEALAVREGVKLAIKENYQKVVIESDSKQVIDEITGKKDGCSWRIKPIIEGIRGYMKRIQEIKFNSVKRNANTAAHEIAQQTVRKMCPLGWVVQPSFSFVYVYCNDGVPAPPCR